MFLLVRWLCICLFKRLNFSIVSAYKLDSISLIIFLYKEFSRSCHFRLSDSRYMKDYLCPRREDKPVSRAKKITFDLFTIVIDRNISFCLDDLCDIICLYRRTSGTSRKDTVRLADKRRKLWYIDRSKQKQTDK